MNNTEWFGKIPASWMINRLKSVLIERNESNKPVKTDFILSLTNDRGVIPYYEKGAIGNNSKDDLTGYKLAYPNDLVLNSMNVIIGSVGISSFFGCVSPVYYMLRPRIKDDSIEFYNYLFQTKELQNALKGYGNGILEIRMRIAMSKLNTFLLPTPSSIIQRVIVEKIKESEIKIDQLIANQQQQIEKLKEYKQSLISEVVTKGLNANVEYKDSGIDWIGKIPKNTKLVQLKRLATINNGKEIKNIDGEIPVYGSGGIFKYTDEFLFEGESILYGRKGTIDKPLHVNGKFWTVDTMFYTEILEFVTPRYLFYVSVGAINFDYYKSGSVLPSMTQFELGNVRLPLFDKKTQGEITDYLDCKISLIDKVIEQKYLKINNLEDYKKSLIYEYVTGKKEVS